MEIKAFDPGDEGSVVRLWTEFGLEVPWNDSHRDIRRKLRVQGEWFLVGCSKGRGNGLLSKHRIFGGRCAEHGQKIGA